MCTLSLNKHYKSKNEKYFKSYFERSKKYSLFTKFIEFFSSLGSLNDCTVFLGGGWSGGTDFIFHFLSDCQKLLKLFATSAVR